MKGTDRTILLILPLVALAIAFWLLVISPKQKELNDLSSQVDTLNSSISTSESDVVAAEEARKSFAANYSEIVSLGSAVPEDSDQATLIYDLTRTSEDTGVHFRSFELADAGDVAASDPAPPVAATTTTTEPGAAPAPAGSDSTETSTTTATATTPVGALPTEAAAATLPIGATVGAAGLPVMPYKLKFNGSFFDMADFFAALDKGVTVSDSGTDPKVSGRLLTVNGFAMVGDPVHGFPLVQASLALNTYIVPGEQGLSAGATPAGPSVTATDPSTVASTSATSTVPGAAAVSP